jgi:cell wall-associated NlpC family hydrolase
MAGPRGLIAAAMKPARQAVPTAFSQPTRQALAAYALAASMYADLLGKPFVAGGRGPANYDCVGLALEMARRLGKTLPNYLSSETELHAQLGAGGATLAGLPQIARPVPGCLVLLRISPADHHIGIMVDEFRMIHTLSGVGCVIERILSNLWQRKVIGFYSL